MTSPDAQSSDAVDPVVAKLRRALRGEQEPAAPAFSASPPLAPEEPLTQRKTPSVGAAALAMADELLGVRDATAGGTRKDRAPWVLVVAGEQIALSSGEWVLGRKLGDADVVIPDGRVSRRHARLVVRGSSANLEDLGSSNGTVIVRNAERLVVGTRPVGLAPGDRFVTVDDMELASIHHHEGVDPQPGGGGS